MNKIVVVLLSLFLTLFANEEINSKIFPVVIKNNSKFELNIKTKNKIVIIYANSNYQNAKNFRDLLELSLTFKADLILKSESELFFEDLNILAFYIFEINDDNLKKIVDFSQKNSIITFSANPEYIKYGVHLSVINKRRPIIIINKSAVIASNIRFSSTLLKVSQIYEK